MRESYVSLIPTPTGSTHESGLREGLFQAVESFVEMHALLPKDVKLMSEDVLTCTSFVFSAKVLDLRFQGQIKEYLNNRDAVRLMSTLSRPVLELWLNQHVDHGEKLAELVIKQAQACTHVTQEVEKKKGSGVAVLPGKLTDCESDDITRNELSLVEGDSTGGSTKMDRGKEFQAILSSRSKALNTWETERGYLFANNEVCNTAVIIGVDPHGLNDMVDLSGSRYGKICILFNADVNDAHIQMLLLTLFFKYFSQLIDWGHVCVARSPLYRVDASVYGKEPVQRLYALDDGELETTEDKLYKGGVKDGVWQISRLKSLGEMSAEQLWETTMNPDTCHLLPVALGELDQDQTINIMNMLTSKGEAGTYRTWLGARGSEVEIDT